ncbi:MAG: hypothetical protein LC660_02450 [Desulfobacteraceae bacterium]|nr:hypothetical protein [Desulfobacteraceae bacterium]
MAALGSATPNVAGQKATGMMHFMDIKADVLLSTFQKMVWQLRYPVPVEMFEENKRCG